MMGKRALMIALAAWALTAGAGCPRPGGDEGAVRAAIGDLQSNDELKVRAAVRRLAGLTKARNIMNAVDPLAAVLNNRERDYYTRALVTDTLGLIAKGRANWKKAKPALAPVEAALLGDRSDLIRAAAAQGLLRSGYGQVQPLLETAYLSDESVLVRAVALDALKQLTGGAYVPPSTEPGSAVAAASGKAGKNNGPPGNASSSLQPMIANQASPSPACVSAETSRWLDQHVIFLGGNGERPPVCGASPGAGGGP